MQSFPQSGQGQGPLQQEQQYFAGGQQVQGGQAYYAGGQTQVQGDQAYFAGNPQSPPLTQTQPYLPNQATPLDHTAYQQPTAFQQPQGSFPGGFGSVQEAPLAAAYNGYQQPAGQQGQVAGGYAGVQAPMTPGRMSAAAYQDPYAAQSNCCAPQVPLTPSRYATVTSAPYGGPASVVRAATVIQAPVTTTFHHPPSLAPYPLSQSAAALAVDAADGVLDGTYFGAPILDAGYAGYPAYARPVYTREYIRTSPPQMYSTREYIAAPNSPGFLGQRGYGAVYDAPPYGARLGHYDRPSYDDAYGPPRRRYDGYDYPPRPDYDGPPPPRSRSVNRRPGPEDLGPYTPSKYRRNPYYDDFDPAEERRPYGPPGRDPKFPPRRPSIDDRRPPRWAADTPPEKPYGRPNQEGTPRAPQRPPPDWRPYGDRSPVGPRGPRDQFDGDRTPDRYYDRIRDRETRFR